MEYDSINKMTTTQRITDDLEAMLAVFPPEVAQAVQSRDNFDNLLEVILDLGRNPSARFTTGEVELLDEPVTQDDLNMSQTVLEISTQTTGQAWNARCTEFRQYATAAEKSSVLPAGGTGGLRHDRDH